LLNVQYGTSGNEFRAIYCTDDVSRRAREPVKKSLCLMHSLYKSHSNNQITIAAYSGRNWKVPARLEIPG